MASRALYDSIARAGAERISAGGAGIDGYLATGMPDGRRGLTLLYTPSSIGPAYRHFMERAAAAVPGQYLYPPEDLHVTVFDFVSAREGFRAGRTLEESCIALCDTVISRTKTFTIEFRGVAFSAAAGLLCGYDRGRLTALRERIRRLLPTHGIQNSERYPSRSAHATFLRFARPPENPEALLAFMRAHREIPLGTISADRLQLVEHDWYNRAATRRLVAEFSVRKA